MVVTVVSMAALACAVSLDGLGVGITYGLRKIRIPFVSIIIIALCSGFILWLSMQAGEWLTGYLSERAAELAGSMILILIGCWALLQLRKDQTTEKDDEAQDEAVHEDHSPLVLKLELKQLGLVIQILRAPQAADVDRSGIISPPEAVMLGTALSLDAFGAGLGAAMLGLPSLLTAAVTAVCSGIFLLCGVRIGMRFADWRGMRFISFIPGLLLIAMGIMKLF